MRWMVMVLAIGGSGCSEPIRGTDAASLDAIPDLDGRSDTDGSGTDARGLDALATDTPAADTPAATIDAGCTGDSECAGYCSAGTCVPNLPSGSPCTRDTQCEFDACTDNMGF